MKCILWRISDFARGGIPGVWRRKSLRRVHGRSPSRGSGYEGFVRQSGKAQLDKKVGINLYKMPPECIKSPKFSEGSTLSSIVRGTWAREVKGRSGTEVRVGERTGEGPLHL